MSPSEEDGDSEARRLAVEALSLGDAAEALRLCRYPTAGSGRAAKTWHWIVAARAHYALGDLRASSQALAEAALAEEAGVDGGGGGGGGRASTTPLASSSSRAISISRALIRSNVAAVSLREGKPRCALLCCSLALSPPSQEQHEQQHEQQQQPPSSSSSSSSSLSPSSAALPAAIRAAATYNAALASLAMEEEGGGGGGRERVERAAAELEALARALDDSEGEEKEEGNPSASAALFLVLGRRARARVWLRAAEALARVAAAAEEKEGGDEEGLWGRASAAASRAAALSDSSPSPSPSSSSAAAAAAFEEPPGDRRCRAAALALVAASEMRLGRVPEAREAIRRALDLDLRPGGGFEEEGGERSWRGADPILLPGARAALESYLQAMDS